MSSIQGLVNQRGKYPRRLGRQQRDDPEVVLHEVVVESGKIRKNRSQNDAKRRQAVGE